MTSEAEVDVIVVGGPVMHPLQIINGTVVLGWDSIPGSRYQVESTTDLDSGDWVDAGSSVSAVGFNAELTIPAEPGEKRFFRVRVDL